MASVPTRFLVDENLPKDFVVALEREGHDVIWVLHCELRHASDEAIWHYAGREERVLLTADLDFPLPGEGGAWSCPDEALRQGDG
jgi:predicted nuclease of predicted toxin-antitoxin system